MISEKAASNAVNGKTDRPCDGCAQKRVRWYCTADDAFLCHACDSLVHSANPLARRHERVRVKTASFKPVGVAQIEIPSWHRGVTKRPRTPRYGKAANHHLREKSESELAKDSFPVVPEFSFDESSLEDNEDDQLLYRVPIYDPFLAELCTPTTNSIEADTSIINNGGDSKVVINGFIDVGSDENLHGFLPSDMDLAEFAADVENLLGRGLENESFGIEELGLIDYNEQNNNSGECSGLRVKLEEKEERVFDSRNYEMNFDYESPATGEEEEEKVVALFSEEKFHGVGDNDLNDAKKKKKILNLDYEAVITAWSECQRSPWTAGVRPESEECLSEFMGICGTKVQYPSVGAATMADVGREARVSRYREKRRIRLFSKKIRYEVRKLNAEKRPRMKGRFVKRTSFA